MSMKSKVFLIAVLVVLSGLNLWLFPNPVNILAFALGVGVLIGFLISSL